MGSLSLACADDSVTDAGDEIGDTMGGTTDDGDGDTTETSETSDMTGDGDGDEPTCDATRSNDAVQLALGGYHTCALLAGGAVRCWGSNVAGQLGYAHTENIGNDEFPASAGNVDVGSPVIHLAGGGYHQCALLEQGTVRCWGSNYDGALGYGQLVAIGDDETPASAGDVPVGGKVIHIDCGRVHTCAVLEGGAVRCWGDVEYARLGYPDQTGNIGDDETPASVGDVDLGGPAVQVATGRNHTCALLEGGAVRCWGLGYRGQLGYGNSESIGDDETPASAGDVPVGGVVTQIVAGHNHTCAVLVGGGVRCWGYGELGQLGYGDTKHIGDTETPASIGDLDIGGPVLQVATQDQHSCAMLEGGAVRCWGYGVLGYGNWESVGDDETPASAGDVMIGGPVAQVDVGEVHNCALLEGGTVRCWGGNLDGQLGYANSETIGDDEVPATAGDVCY